METCIYNIACLSPISVQNAWPAMAAYSVGQAQALVDLRQSALKLIKCSYCYILCGTSVSVFQLRLPPANL